MLFFNYAIWEALRMPFICCTAAIPRGIATTTKHWTEKRAGRRENRTGVPDRRLHGVAFLQQHLNERGADVAISSGHARRLQLRRVARRRRHRRRPPTHAPSSSMKLLPVTVGQSCSLMIDEISRHSSLLGQIVWGRDYFGRTGSLIDSSAVDDTRRTPCSQICQSFKINQLAVLSVIARIPCFIKSKSTVHQYY